MQNRINILEFKNVIKIYNNDVRALDDLSFTVPSGSIFGFIGLNGAGKTSSIRIIASLSRQDSGSVQIFSKEISVRDNSYKREIGFVLDEPLYFDWMPAKDYLKFVGAMYGLDNKTTEHRTDELLEFFDLTSKEDEPIETYSTGMKKKVSLAAAVIHQPRLVVLDEPLEGIDALASSAIKETLKMMASNGTTVLITSHVLETIEKLCSDVAIIDRGKILLQCRTEEIRSKVKGELNSSTYASLEELFVDLVSDKVKKKHLSWL
jgi:ABC-2 type transport system ATP-binding protein